MKINPTLLRPVEELNIAASTADLLKATGIYYVGDLVQRTRTELRRNAPERVVSEIARPCRTGGWTWGVRVLHCATESDSTDGTLKLQTS